METGATGTWPRALVVTSFRFIRRVARGLAGAARKLPDVGDVSIQVAKMNNEPCVVTCHDGQLVSVRALEVTGRQVLGIYRILNPDKLGDLHRFSRARSARGKC